MNRCIFDKKWLRNEEFAEWLEEVENDKYAFRCRVCLKNLELGRMGKSALLRHLKSSKHSDLLKERNYASFTKSWMPKAFNFHHLQKRPKFNQIIFQLCFPVGH